MAPSVVTGLEKCLLPSTEFAKKKKKGWKLHKWIRLLTVKNGGCYILATIKHFGVGVLICFHCG